MPTDIKLDPTTHDLDLASADPVTGLTNTFKLYKLNTKVVAQRVKIALLYRRGEWFRDINTGLPYTQEFFRAKNNKDFVDTTIEQYIAGIEDVISVVSYKSVIINRRLDVTVTIKTTAGIIEGLTLEV